MKTVNVYQAKTMLSQLLADVERGEEVVIARTGEPVARLTPFQPAIARGQGFGGNIPAGKTTSLTATFLPR